MTIPKGPTIFHHILQETVFLETVKTASNAATDAIAQIVNKNLQPKTSGLALLEIASIVQVVAINGIHRILNEKTPDEYDSTSEVSRLASIMLHQRSLAPSSSWHKIFQWSADDYFARYRVRSDIAARLIASTSTTTKGKKS